MANVKDLLVNGSARIIGTIYGNATSATDSDKLDGKHLNEIASAKSTTLAWSTSSTIATIGGNNITVTMPANPNTDTHYTTGITAGATGTTSNSATTNGNTFIKIKDNSTHRGQIKLVGSGATSVSSDANGIITISSTDNNTTYGSMSVSEGTTGTATSNRVLTAANLKGIINAHAPTKTGSGASGTWGISISGNAATATKATQDGNSKVITAEYVHKTNSSSTLNQFSGAPKYLLGIDAFADGGEVKWQDISNIKVGSADTASKVNNKLTVGSKTYDGSAAISIAASDLGLASAMLFLGTTTTAITDGATTNPVAIGGSNKTVTAGNVVLYGSKEFVWTGSAWEELGNEGSYKVVQAAVGDPSASGTSNTFIATISQDANGKITATKKTVAVTNSAPTLSWGATSTIGTVAGTNLQVKMPANPNTWRGIQNNLTSDSTTDSLSAAQGKALKALIDGKAASSHTHSYLPLSGGTLTGNLQIGNSDFSSTSADAVGIIVRDLRAVSMAPSTLGDRTAVFYFDEAGPSGDNSWKGILRVKGWTDSYAAWELAGPATSTDTKEFYVRSGPGGGTWGSWRKLLTDDNYTSYTVTKTGSGASGTWGISISGNAATATKATKDSTNQQINTTYIKGLSVSGRTITYTKGDGSTGTITTQDTNTTYGVATSSANGLMSSADKSKLDGIAAGANKYSHPTSSGNKHIPAGGSSGQILRWSADGTAVWGADTNTWRGIQNNLTSDSTTDSLAAAQGKALKALIDGKAASSHTHDDRYYTESEMNTKLSGKSDTGHTHDDRYYTESEIDTKLNGKANSSHGTHIPSTCTSITDWNSATTNGWYMGSNISNQPVANGGWFYGLTIVHNSNYVRQIAWHFASDNSVSGTNNDRYERVKHNGTWGSWVNTSVRTAVPSNAKFTDTTYSAATTSAAGLMSKDDKAKLDGITASADAVSFSRSLTSGTKVGTITINGTGTDLYAPTNTDTHWTTGLKVGASNTATANAAASNGSVYLNVLDNSTVRDSHKITGSGATSVTSDANGVITISSTNTTYGVATTSANGLMSSTDKSKLDGIASGANKYSLPAATSSTLGGVKVGSNITVSSGTISLTKANVTSALGYTPPTSDTNTWKANTASSEGYVASGSGQANKVWKTDANGVPAWRADANTTYSVATTSANGLMSSSDKSKLDGIAAGANKITVDSALSSTSTNPVQNKVINTALAGKAASSHTHDDRYYTESEINTKINTINTAINNISTVYYGDGVDNAIVPLNADQLQGHPASYFATAEALANSGLKMDLLWTNANPNSNFSQQTISLDLADYKFVLIKSKRRTSSTMTNQPLTSIGLKGAGNYISAPDTDVVAYRIYAVTENSIIFLKGNYTGANGERNDLCIPLEIYGVR